MKEADTPPLRAPRHDRIARAVAVVLVVSAHLLVFVLFPRAPHSVDSPPAQHSRIIVSLVQEALHSQRSTRTAPFASTRAEPGPRPRSRAQAEAPVRPVRDQSTSSAQVSPSDRPVGALPNAALPASPPLRLDDEVLRRAIKQSRSREDLVTKSNERLASGTAPAETRLASAVTGAAIPDCARPDALKRMPVRAGGLLDLPLLAYAAIKGLCK